MRKWLQTVALVMLDCLFDQTGFTHSNQCPVIKMKLCVLAFYGVWFSGSLFRVFGHRVQGFRVCLSGLGVRSWGSDSGFQGLGSQGLQVWKVVLPKKHFLNFKKYFELWKRCCTIACLIKMGSHISNSALWSKTKLSLPLDMLMLSDSHQTSKIWPCTGRVSLLTDCSFPYCACLNQASGVWWNECGYNGASTAEVSCRVSLWILKLFGYCATAW